MASASTLADGVVVIPRRSIHASSPWLRPRRLSALPIFAERATTVYVHRESLDTRLGIRVVVYDPHTRQLGATVGTVDVHSLCWRAGLVAGDRITSITCDGATVEIADGRAAMTTLEVAHGTIAFGLKRRRWTDADIRSQKLQAAWRGARARSLIRARAKAAQLVQRTWRASGRKRRAARAIHVRPSNILALARLSSGSTVGSTSQGRNSAASSEPSRRDSYEFRE